MTSDVTGSARVDRHTMYLQIAWIRYMYAHILSYINVSDYYIQQQLQM